MILSTHGIVGSISGAVPLLLDVYTNAAAAYSVRKLRTLYTGNAIQVRRSSDNTTQNIGFTLTGDLDISALTSFCGSGDGFVTTWYDQSGNARNATQTTAANQPQIVSSGSMILQNGKPTIKFDGSNDGFTTTLSGSITNLSVNKVETWNSISGGQLSSNFNDGIYLQWSENSNTWANYTATQGRGATTANTNQTLFSYYDANGFYQNNSLTRATTSVGNSFSQFTMGFYSAGSLPANVNIQEMIVWTSQQVSNRNGISSNINTYYAIY